MLKNAYLRNMSKATRMLARIVGALFYTVAVVIYVAKGSFERGRTEIDGDDNDNG